MHVRSTPYAAAFTMMIASQCAIAAPARAAGSSAAIDAARRDVEIAQLELRRYLVIDYPAQRTQLDSQIAMAHAEIESNRRLVREYERMSRGKTSRPFLVTLEDARLALLAAKLRHHQLGQQKSNLEKFHSDQCRLYELHVEAARQRLESLLKAHKRG
jgi:hypothetical protein